MTYEFFTVGENIFNAGEYGNKFYVILKGKVGINIPEPGYKPPAQIAPQPSVKERPKRGFTVPLKDDIID